MFPSPSSPRHKIRHEIKGPLLVREAESKCLLDVFRCRKFMFFAPNMGRSQADDEGNFRSMGQTPTSSVRPSHWDWRWGERRRGGRREVDGRGSEVAWCGEGRGREGGCGYATVKQSFAYCLEHTWECAANNGKRCCEHTKRTGCWRRPAIRVLSLSVASWKPTPPVTNGKDALVKLRSICCCEHTNSGTKRHGQASVRVV